jgi:hypothetical protein
MLGSAVLHAVHADQQIAAWAAQPGGAAADVSTLADVLRWPSWDADSTGESGKPNIVHAL